MLRALPMAVWVTAVWVALWGDLSWANLVGGMLVAALVLVVVPLPRGHRPRRAALGPSLRYAARFARDLTVATWEVSRQVFWPVERLRPAVLAVPLRSRDPGLLSLVANTITLTPGTLTLQADRESATLFVHVLHLEPGQADDVIGQAQGLERLGARAMGIDLDAGPPPRAATGGTPQTGQGRGTR